MGRGIIYNLSRNRLYDNHVGTPSKSMNLHAPVASKIMIAYGFEGSPMKSSLRGARRYCVAACLHPKRLREPSNCHGVRGFTYFQALLLHLLQLVRWFHLPGLHRRARDRYRV